MSGLTEEEHDAYSRQIAAYGVEMMMRLKTMDVLVVGLQGVGIETAKNLVLSGPRSVTVHDPTPCTVPDLGLNFFLSQADCTEKKPRDIAVAKKLQELNPRVQVRTLFSGVGAANPNQEPNVLQLPIEGTGELTEKIVGMFSVVIFCGNQHTRKELLKWNKFCRTFKTKHVDPRGQETNVEQAIGFIACSTFGVAGYVFGDFGAKHSVFDDDGQPAPSRAIVGITNDVKGVVTIDNNGAMLQGVEVDDHAGWFEISGVKGMQNRNRGDGRGASINEGLWKFGGKKVEVKEESTKIAENGPPVGEYPQFKYKIEEKKAGEKRMVITKSVNSAFDFYIGDTSGFTPYEGGGVLTQKKVPVVKHFKSLSDSIISPTLVESDYSKMGRPEQLHIGFQALYDFREKHNRWPCGVGDLKEVTDLAKAFNATNTVLRDRLGQACCVEEVDEKVLEKLVRCAPAELQPLGAFFGGIVAQEAMKWTGKFDPMNQLMCVDLFEMLDDLPPNDIKPLGTGNATRYDHQLAIFGEAMHKKIQNQVTFMVGCGALGCEYLKNFALIGLSTGPKGKIFVTDNDRIEVSNLNRQFLFREHNVGQMKSEAGKSAVLQMNPDMHIEAKDVLVMPASENTFNDAFWEGLDFVTNALDNIIARNYIDGRCVFYGKPLLESGTQGTMCNGLVVLPKQTLSYTDGPKVDENAGGGIPMCTLRNFPNLVTHCVEWARAMFTDIFCAPFQDAQKFASNPAGFLANLEEEVGGDPSRMSSKLEELTKLNNVLQEAKGITFEGCVKQAFDLLHGMHRDNILNLIHQYPENAVDKESKLPFWSGSKRFPQAAHWDINNKMLTAYVISVANILAVCYGLGKMPDLTKPGTLVPKEHPWREVASVAKALEGVKAKPFTPSSKHIALSDEEEKNKGPSSDDAAKYHQLVEALKKAECKGLTFQPADFEKDCDANFHIDFIAAATNLRAWNYQLETCTRDKAKVIAGRIIPAILTATASITGLMACEMVKLVQGRQREAFRDSSNDLATNSYRFSEPTEVNKRDEKAKALVAVKRDEKFLEQELQKPWVGADKPHMNRNLVKVLELSARISGHHTTIKESRAVPEGFTKWDRTVLKGNDKTIAQLCAELSQLTGKIVSSLSLGSHTLYSAEFESPFETVATGLARRLADKNTPAFLREAAYKVYQAHQAGGAINGRFRNATMQQAASMVGALAFPRKFLELHVTLVDSHGNEWDAPPTHFTFGQLTSAVAAEGEAEGGGKKKVVASKLSASAMQRVRKELSRFGKNPPDNASIVVGEKGDPASCIATLLGPEGTPYAGGIFSFEYNFPPDYPSSPPKLRCLTKVFHCNVNESGTLCGIPQIKEAWTPALRTNDILQCVISLLMSPSFEDPLMPDISALHKRDPKAHDAAAADATKKYATHTPDNTIDWSKVKINEAALGAASRGEEKKAGTNVEALQRPPAEIEQILKGFKPDWEMKGWKVLDLERHKRYAQIFPALAKGTALSVSTADPTEEKVVHIVGNEATEILQEDSIMLSDITPCELVEYKFKGSEWMVAKIGLDSLGGYRSSKFSLWKKNALGIWRECLASFMRVLKGGPICNMFDDRMFPEAPGDEKDWQVVDAAGKVRRVAHPVEAMRVFRPATNSYETVDTRLDGAPAEDQLKPFWDGIMTELRQITTAEVGAEFMEDCFRLDEATLKKKYS